MRGNLTQYLLLACALQGIEPRLIPPAPVLTANDKDNTLIAALDGYNYSDFEYSKGDGELIPYPQNGIDIGNIDRAEGYIKVRVRRVAGKWQSGEFALSPAFTYTSPIPDYNGSVLGVIADSFGTPPFLLLNPVAQALNMVLVSNAVSGRCATSGTDNAEGDGTYRVPAIDALPSFLEANRNIRVFIIEPGLNDYHYLVPIGNQGTQDILTLRGAYRRMIELAKAQSNIERIICIVPAVRADRNRNGSGGGELNVSMMQPYADAIKAVAIEQAVEYVDQWSNPDLSFAKIYENTTDGAHFTTPIGVQRWTTPIINKIKPPSS